MSWNLFATGTKEKVRAKVEANPVPSGFSAAEALAYESGKKALLAAIDEIIVPDDMSKPWGCNGVAIEFSGSGGTFGANMKIDVKKIRLEI